jgi:hypothetical protein
VALDEYRSADMLHSPAAPGRRKKWLTAEAVLVRYGDRNRMWIERLLEADPNFPRPRYISGKRYWEEEQLELWEAALPLEPPQWLATATESAVRAAKAKREASP